jgi:hypothetical protein
MSLTLPTFASGSRIRASELALITAALNALTPIKVIKSADQNYATSSTVLQNDTHLFVVGQANTTYEFDLYVAYVESTGTGVDMKIALTQPSGCRFDAGVTGPNVNWTSSPTANLEAEWSAWVNETGTTTSTRPFGTVNGVPFSMEAHGTWQVGATGGTLRVQASQNTSSANTLTIKSGSSLIITPTP